MRNRRPPTEAAYNIRIAPNKTINPATADPRHTLSNIAMMTLPNVLKGWKILKLSILCRSSEWPRFPQQ
jgi:hypothetical protein